MKTSTFLLSILLLIVCGQGWARSSNTTMRVTATIPPACLVTANNLAFDRFDPLKPISPTNGQAQTNIYLTCTAGSNYTIFLSAGNSANFSTRSMSGSEDNPNKVLYNLYTDPTFINIWGDLTQSYDSGTGTGFVQDYVVYGQIDGGQATSIRPDHYVDTIQINVIY